MVEAASSPMGGGGGGGGSTPRHSQGGDAPFSDVSLPPQLLFWGEQRQLRVEFSSRVGCSVTMECDVNGHIRRK